jgi:ankyrin repeat protein
VVGYKPAVYIRKYVESGINPFRAWESGCIKAWGLFFGNDKVGHFTDMGNHYWRAYRDALKAGKSEDEAMSAALWCGTNDPLTSERGLLGLWTAGAYSNGDLIANFMGFCFYKNLTSPAMLKGRTYSPMLEKDGPYWKLAARVRRDSDFFSLFFPEHLNEALNPSLYRDDMRGGIRKAVREYRSDIIERYVDANGNRQSKEWFAEKVKELSTYYGVNYGHEGTDKSMITIANTCFDDLPADAAASARNWAGETPMHQAAGRGDVKGLDDLLRRGGDPNVQIRSDEHRNSDWGDTPLHYAARNGQLEAAKFLLDHGANPNAKNDRGVTPLHRAIHSQQIAQALLDRGAQINAKDGSGETAAHWAAGERDSGALSLLLARGADPNARDNDGETPLHKAARRGAGVACAELIGRGAKVDSKDRFNVTPLHVAAASNDPVVARMLLAAGAPANAADDFGVTPLHDAARAGSEMVVAMLMDGGAKPSVADAYGNTPLHLAAREDHPVVAQALVRGGADAMARAGSGETPTDLARKRGDATLLSAISRAQAPGAPVQAAYSEPATR